MNLPPTLLDPPHPSASSTIQRISPIAEIKSPHYTNKTLNFNQLSIKPTFTTILFDLTLTESSLQLGSVSTSREVNETQILSFKSSKDHTNKQAAISIVEVHGSKNLIEIYNLQSSCEKCQSFMKTGGLWYEMREIYGNDEEELCCICLGEVPTVVSLPCRHMVSCASCAVELRTKNRFCPLCRAEIDVLVRVQ
eukprot:EST45330.1 RING finger domain-containing protein [Spironucleus salmonicida]